MQPADSRPRWMVYGANGYTGQLVLDEAARRQLPLIVAGRRAGAIYRLAEQYGQVARVFALAEPTEIARQLDGVDLLLNCAGPFADTAEPLVEACLLAGCHYLDITGEIDVIEQVAARQERAESAGVTLMPAVGFDVVPSDCLAARLAEALPGATLLQLAFSAGATISPGTAKTLLRRSGRGGQVRKGGQIVAVPTAWKRAEIEFPSGKRWAITIPWGDVATAYYTTRIPDIEVYVALGDRQIRQLRKLRWLEPAARWRAVQWAGRKLIEALLYGPTERQRNAGRAEFWGSVSDGEHQIVQATLTTPEGYSLTAQTAVEIAGRVLAGQVEAGFLTPGQAFGGQLLDELSGVEFRWR